MMETYAVSIALAITSIASLYLIFSPKFCDTLLQRIGLCLICFGASVRFITALDGLDVGQSRRVLAYGICIYLVATILKYWRVKP